jgi:putative transposase
MNKGMKIDFPERKQIRLPQYDYSSDGYYFVTICTKDRLDFFGKIRNGIMGLNEFGCIAAKCCQEIPKYFDNVLLDAWQIMPNHIHGILIIRNSVVGDAFSRPIENRYNVCDAFSRPVPMNSRDATRLGTRDAKTRPLRQINRSKMLIPKIINGFKSSVTRQINRMQNKIIFQWQRSYYDHIIRDEKSLNNIYEYIKNNPYNWTLDVENRKNKYGKADIKNHYDSFLNEHIL